MIMWCLFYMSIMVQEMKQEHHVPSNASGNEPDVPANLRCQLLSEREWHLNEICIHLTGSQADPLHPTISSPGHS